LQIADKHVRHFISGWDMEKAINHATDDARRVRRNRLYFLAGLAVVLALGGTFAHLTLQALNVRATTSSEFPQYVVDHRIGHAEIADDESGMQQDFCVVHLNKAPPDSQIANELLDLLNHYHQLDGGTILTAEYDIPGTGKNTILGDAVLNEETNTVRLTVNTASGKHVVERHVDWNSKDSDAS
jgi:hypothetical protein